MSYHDFAQVVERCRGGRPLDDDYNGTSIWPRALYPSLDDALLALWVESGEDPDESLWAPFCRLVWAWPAWDSTGWAWTPFQPRRDEQTVECWELSWR